MPASDADRTILIVGAGIAGLALGLALAHRGRRSMILERRQDPAEAGAGIQLGPNGIKALDSLGLRSALASAAGRPQGIAVHDGLDGRLLQTLPLGDWLEHRHGAPYLVAHRSDLQRILMDRVRIEPAIQLRLGFEVTDLELLTTGVGVRSADNQWLEGPALIGADGVHSTIRRHIDQSHGPRFTGRTAARAVVPTERLAASSRIDLQSTGVWLAPAMHIVHYPVRAGGETAFVIIRTEDWQEPHWSAPVSRESLMQAISPLAKDIRDLVGADTEWHKWALFDADPLPRWSRGRIVLAGDAAHPVLPFLAQGGCLALEDAIVLADGIAGSAAFDGDPTPSFATYESLRKPRATRVLLSARRNGRIYHLHRSAAWARNLTLRILPPERVMAGYDWLYGWQPPDRAE